MQFIVYAYDATDDKALVTELVDNELFAQLVTDKTVHIIF